MKETKDKITSLTHSGTDKLSKQEIATELNQIKERLSAEFNGNPDKLNQLLETLDALSEFELGRFLIKNKSLSGYWTWYVIQGFNNSSISSPIEKYLVEKAPAILATRERFNIFQTLLSKHIKSNSVVCSLPCGMMADLLTLQLPQGVTEVRFVGIDLDAAVFDLARELAKELKVQTHCEFFHKDAWNLNIHNQFDLITSNGLNLYESDDNKVVALYRGIFNALKNQGYFICSALTSPPTPTTVSEWDMDRINKADLETSATIFKTILQATWSNFRSSEKTCDQLHEAGFNNVEIFWDTQKMFPTFLAHKNNDQINRVRLD